MKPMDEVITAMVLLLDEGQQELWQERAAIRESDGGQARELAESMALIDVIRTDVIAVMARWSGIVLR